MSLSRTNLILLFSLASFAQAPKEDHVASILQHAADLELQGQGKEAERLIKSVLKQTGDVDAAIALNELGLLYCTRNRQPEAERCYKQALSLVETSKDPFRDVILARLIMNLAALYVEALRFNEAERLRVSSHMKNLSNDFDINQGIGLLAALHTARGRTKEAERLYLDMLPFLRSRPEPRIRVSLATTLNNLGTLALRNNDPATAISRLEEAIAVWKATTGPNYPNLFKTMVNLGCAHRQAKQFDQAVAYFEEASTLSRDSLGPLDPFTIAIRLELMEALKKAGRKAEAKLLKRETDEARAQLAHSAARHTVDVSSLVSRR